MPICCSRSWSCTPTATNTPPGCFLTQHAACTDLPQVWDTFGRCLYSSRAMEQAVTSLGWSPSGGVFAVGSFNTLTLCDRMGWSHSKVRGCGCCA